MLRKWHILAISVISISAITILSIDAQQDFDIPPWVKQNALWWGQGDISDSDFVSAINFLIEKNIVRVSSSGSDEDIERSQKLQAKINSLESENERLKDDVAFWKNKYEDAVITGSSKSSTTTSKPTEFSTYDSWTVKETRINIKQLAVDLYQFGFMKGNDKYFGVDMEVTFGGTGKPLELVTSDITITDDDNFVYRTTDTLKETFDGIYYEDDSKRGIILFENIPKNINVSEIEVTFINKNLYDSPWTFTYEFT